MARAECCGQGAGQRMRSFRPFGIDRGDVQHRHQAAVDAEDGCGGAAQVDMPRSKVLVSVDSDRPLFGDAGADAVRAFDRLGPHAAEPGSPVFEPARVCFVTAMFDRDARRITEEKRISRLANDLVEPIDLLLRAEDQLVERLSELLELVRRQDAGRLAAVGVDAVLVRRSLPGGRYLLDTASGDVRLRDQEDVLSVPYGHFDRPWGTPRDPPYLGRLPEYAPVYVGLCPRA